MARVLPGRREGSQGSLLRPKKRTARRKQCRAWRVGEKENHIKVAGCRTRTFEKDPKPQKGGERRSVLGKDGLLYNLARQESCISRCVRSCLCQILTF